MRQRRLLAEYRAGDPARLLVADPPWPFDDALPKGKSKRDPDADRTRGAGTQYGLLTHLQIRRFPLPPLAADCALILWRVSSMVEEAYAVVRAWGFTPKSELVWRKMRRCGKCKGAGYRLRRGGLTLLRIECAACGGTGQREHFGMGRSVRNCHEVAVIAHRGRPARLDGGVRSVFSALMPTGAGGRIIHSAKPPEFYDLAVRLYGGPRVELFARRPRDGWECYGDELPGEEAGDGRASG